MTRATAFRGQPLLVLTALLVGWIAVRASLWQPPFAAPRASAGVMRPAGGGMRRLADRSREPFVRELLPAADGATLFQSSAIVLIARRSAVPVRDFEPASPPHAITSVTLRPATTGRLSLGIDAPHAVSTRLTMPLAAPLPVRLRPRRKRSGARWSADGWLLLRRGGADSVLASRPSYGRSQAGGIVRYHLAATSPLRPRVYLRASAALAGPREQEVAVGLSARPADRLPIRVAAEARVTESSRGTRIRPAAYAVTEVPPFQLPLDMTAEVYAQAGYVGGDFATAFADGQVRVDRAVFQREEAEISGGVGLWGGAQKGASRLDIGPTAAVSFRIRGARARVEAGYRLRVAGAAAPASGPTLTLSAGF